MAFLERTMEAVKQITGDAKKDEETKSDETGSHGSEDFQLKKAEYLNMTLNEKRRICKEKLFYTTKLQDLATWPQLMREHPSHVYKAWGGEDKRLKAKYAVNPSFNSKILLCQGDITSMEVEAIVNAARKDLDGGTTVSAAIHAVAGIYLTMECASLQGCNMGMAKMTGGYQLPAKHVIHTVGPTYRRSLKTDGLEELRSCYTSCLKLVKENGIKSVAFPCISTGAAGLAPDLAADVALETVRKFLEEDEYSSMIEHIVFCAYENTDVECYEVLLPVYFPLEKYPQNVDIKEETYEKLSSLYPKQSEIELQLSTDTELSGYSVIDSPEEFVNQQSIETVDELKAKITQLQNSLDTEMIKSAELSEKVSSIEKENDELQITNSKFEKENDELRITNSKFKKENDELRITNSKFEKENDELRITKSKLKTAMAKQESHFKEQIGDLSISTVESEQLKKENEMLLQIKDDLEKSVASITKELYELKNKEEQTFYHSLKCIITELGVLKDHNQDHAGKVMESMARQEEGLEKVVEHIQELSPPTDPVPVCLRTPKQVPEQLKTICQELTARIGKEWRQFGRCLNLTGDVLDEISQFNKEYGYEELVWAVLEQWSSITECPTQEELLQALRNLEIPSLRDDPMSDQHKKCLQENTTLLLDDIVDVWYIVSCLYEDDIISLNQQHYIMMASTRSASIKCLLDMLPSLGCRAFESFCKALKKTGQKHIYTALEASSTLVKMSSSSQAPATSQILDSSPTSVSTSSNPTGNVSAKTEDECLDDSNLPTSVSSLLAQSTGRDPTARKQQLTNEDICLCMVQMEKNIMKYIQESSSK